LKKEGGKIKKKLRFGGISFGGNYPHVIIFGKKYKTVFGRDRKNNDYRFEVKKKTRWDFFLKYFYFLFPLIDVLQYVTYNPPQSVSHAVKPAVEKTAEVSESMGGFYISAIGVLLVTLLYMLTFFYLYYYLIFRGVRTWHGTEHKVISAAEENDIENAKKYNPIHERCGGTLLPTIFLGYFIYIFIYAYTGFPFGEFTIVTILLFLNVKFFHKYDKFGIWFGKKFQKYFSISEPSDWQLKIGQKAMGNLLKAEKEEQYETEGKVFDMSIGRTGKLTKKGYIFPSILLVILIMVILDMMVI